MEQTQNGNEKFNYRVKLVLPEMKVREVTALLTHSGVEQAAAPKQPLFYTVVFPDGTYIHISCNRQRNGEYLCEAELYAYIWGRYMLMDKVDGRKQLTGSWELECIDILYTIEVTSDAATDTAKIVPETEPDDAGWSLYNE